MKIVCPKCSVVYDVPESYEGKRVQCNTCEEKFTVGRNETIAEIPNEGVSRNTSGGLLGRLGWAGLGFLAGGGMVLLLLIMFFVASFNPSGGVNNNRELSLETYSQRIKYSLNQELKDPSSQFRTAIEMLHKTVKVKSAHVTEVEVLSTVSGVNSAGVNGENVAKVRIVIDSVWDGWINKDKRTVVQFVVDQQAKRISRPEVKYTEAAFTLQPDEWQAVENLFTTACSVVIWLNQ